MASGTRPPPERRGVAGRYRGREIVLGLGLQTRSLGVRTTPYEMWSPLRTLTTGDVGYKRLRGLHGSQIDKTAFRRFVAYLRQAETFYMSAEGLPPESRPLVAYYFVLNLTKAFLTCVDPRLTAARMQHGLSDAFQQHQRYWFNHEITRVHQNGVFPELARRTGAGYCHPSNTNLSVQRFAPYLVETADLFEEAVARPPKLLPISGLEIRGRNGWAWLRAEVMQGELTRRGVGSRTLTNRAHHFGAVFRQAQDPDVRTRIYESQRRRRYRPANSPRVDWPAAFERLRRDFERSLIHTNRGTTGTRHLIVLSDRSALLSQEAVGFLVMHHLSNMVRYRPEQVEKLVGQRWFFLFTMWVPRAMENFLLAMTCRILQEEVRIE
jgi:hypothetical protein